MKKKEQELPIEPLAPREGYELSPYQRGLWSLAQINPGNPFYNASRLLKLTGPLDFENFRRALQIFSDRHSIWRAGFYETANGPVQRVLELQIECPLEDVSDLETQERERVLVAHLEETAWLPFDLEQPPLVRWHAFRFAPEDHRVIMTVHHIISDGGSAKLMMEELAALYQALRQGDDLPPGPELQYHDFSHWQNERLANGLLSVNEGFWLRYLGGDVPVIDLPADRQRPAVPTYRGGQYRRVLSQELTRGIRKLRRQQKTTVFRLMLAALKTLVVRLTGESDVIIGSPASGRTHAVLGRVHGLFVNMLALRTDLSGDPTFSHVLTRVKDSTRDAIDHKDFPFDVLVHALNPHRDSSRPPLFNIVMVMREPTFADEFPAGDMVISQDEVPLTRISRYDLTILVAQTRAGLRLTFGYATDLFDRASIARLADSFERLLEGVVADPDERISRLPLLSARERHLIQHEWNDTELPCLEGLTLDRLIEAQVKQRSETPAVVLEDQQLTYRELDEEADRLAHHLCGLGVEPETLVGIFMERSLEMVVALLAVLKAGGAYLPLDPSYPEARLAFMIEDSRVKVLLTQENLRPHLPENVAQLVSVALSSADATAKPVGKPVRSAVAANLAYVIYTSGSTGRPKGVQVSHEGLANLAAAQSRCFEVRPGDRALQFASLSFDASVFEITMALTHGATLYLVPPALAGAGSELMRILHEKRITNATLPPSILIAESVRDLPQLKTLITAGEACPADVIRKWSPGRRFWNAYGPTEATIWSSVALCHDDGSKPTIGYPIDNTRIHLLDPGFQPVPVGCAGEILIASVGLARGYLHRPGLTAEKFVPDPFGRAPGTRLYRTGDLARYRSDGRVDFLGRIDDQVKIHGFRIESGEIEAALDSHPGLREAVLVVHEECPGRSSLIAYAVAAGDSPPEAGELREFLRRTLPHYMIPSQFIFVEEIPRSPNGKFDRKALPAPSSARQEGHEYIAPHTSTQRKLCQIWEDILGVSPVGIEDDFFELGGHSLVAISLVSKINQQLGACLSVTALMQAPTIAGVSDLIKSRADHDHDYGELARGLILMRAGERSGPALFCVHAFRGSVFAYHGLASNLDGIYPIYGLQAQGLWEGEKPLESVPAMASRHLRLIRWVQPEGPYRLVGWSFGGIVAYEVARQLEREGQTVDILALLDASPPEDLVGQVSEHVTLSQIGRFFFGLDSASFAGLDENASLELLLRHGRETQAFPAGMDLDGIGRLVEVVRANAKALARYHLEGQVRAGICLIRADSSSQVRDAESWRRRTMSNYQVFSSPGPHHDMVYEPAVKTLAQVLEGVLTKARSEAWS